MKHLGKWLFRLLTLFAAVGLLGSRLSAPSADGAASAPTTASQPSAKLPALAFMSGRWQTELGGDQLEEFWSPAAGDSMMGVFRWMKNGKVWMNELLTIVDEGDEVVFRLKHFDAKMVGWEEKGEALTLKLVRSTPTEVVFEQTKPDKPLKFTYRKVGENLIVQIESARDGKPKTDEFTLRPARN